MRVLSTGALLLAPVVGAASLFPGEVASANIRLDGVLDGSLSLRFDVHESDDACGHANVAVGGKDLPEGSHGELTLGDNIPAMGRWKAVCTGDEQFLMVAIDSVPGQHLEGIEFVVRFRQTTPVAILDVAGPVTFDQIATESLQTMDSKPLDDIPLAIEDIEVDLAQDFVELEMLRDMVADLEAVIDAKERLIVEMSLAEDGGDEVHEEKCQGVLCFLKGLFDRLTGLGHPGRGRWPHKGHCGNHSRGNHSHGNHTFPHPPWWKPHHPHGNHTHGNHTIPHPPWWRHPHGNHTHGNHTHGNHTFPHPPWKKPHHRPPFFCRPHHRPGRPPHRKPPHGRPPHGEPPHQGPPHGGPPHRGPPHKMPSFARPPFGHPYREEDSEQLTLGQSATYSRPLEKPGPTANSHSLPAHGPMDLFHAVHPLVNIGIIVALISALIITLHARCCAGRNHMTWEERREARRAFRAAKRAAMRRRWIAFLDMLRPEEEYGYRAEEGRADKTAMLAGCGGEEVVVDEKSDMLIDEKLVEAKEQEEGVMSMSMSQEIASFQDVAAMVSEMVAAEEKRTE
ncbi:hypothetical protein QBC34DRAFT_63799 [Podospora aff. communis PSN243]|uniref:Uncharacterized protein n=1 Tax=Podospora aff. communis PSN243 TaxID=3040156 RepID=A0AAV9GQR0_9PEZI|nr:hypothetical protein QBC34DRAFT_63799 [Podospora aff. communis PSN243]